VGAKGGVGTTTLAVNVAATLAKAAKDGTLLIDLATPYGDAAAYLGAEPRLTLVDALENTHRLDEAFIRGVVVRTSAGVDLLAAADRGPGSAPDSGRLRALFDFARQHFEYTVLDVPRTDPATLDALGAATVIVVVLSQELTAVRSATRLLEWLRQRYGADRVKTVIGRLDASAEIGTEELEKVLGGPLRGLPSDYRRALEALNRGRPLVLENHSRVASEVQRLARELGGVAPKLDEGRRATSKWRLFK
jgi:pilus assembly protein CpaE